MCAVTLGAALEQQDTIHATSLFELSKLGVLGRLLTPGSPRMECEALKEKEIQQLTGNDRRSTERRSRNRGPHILRCAAESHFFCYVAVISKLKVLGLSLPWVR